MKEEILFASSVCGGCKSAIALALQPKYSSHVRIVFVNEKTPEPTPNKNYDEMVAARVTQTPVLLTRDGKQIAGGLSISEYLERVYG